MRKRHPRLAEARYQAGDRRCPYCRGLMLLTERGERNDPRRMSRDHILPRQWGGARLDGIANNRRFVCQHCNQMRAAVGHCVGALACVRVVAEDRCVLLREVLREWKMHEKVAQIRIPEG